MKAHSIKNGADTKPLTPAALERKLARAFEHVRTTYVGRTRPLEELPEYKNARATWRALRTAHGFKTAGIVLSEDIGKTLKNETRTFALALLPAATSEIANTCAFEDDCASTCVAFSGKGGMDDVTRSRLSRLTLMVEHPRAFAWLLTAELLEIEREARRFDAHNGKPARLVRLNAYSDIRWERVARWLLDECAHVGFYDYTKHTLRSRPVESLPANYRLTYSVSRRSKLDEVLAAARAGRNPAVVFSARANSNHDTLPATWLGLDVHDGDADDDRYSDAVGVVVGLRRKGSMSTAGALVRAGEDLEHAHQATA